MSASEALRLADRLDLWGDQNDLLEAAAELRRLHIENEALGLHLSERMNDLSRVEAQRDALLEALKMMRDKYGEYACSVCDHADAAIKVVEEGK